MKRDPWNRCDTCGKFVPLKEFLEGGGASHTLVIPDAYGSEETWETLCKEHSGRVFVARIEA
jgi:hypothetical protein